jgi:anti-anti-sigma factor
LEIKSEVTNGITVCRLTGKIDGLTGPALESSAASAINEGNSRLIFDMRQVTYVSSAGLRSILLTAKRAEAAEGGLAIFGLQSAVNKVFEITGLHDLIPIVSDENQARFRLGP